MYIIKRHPEDVNKMTVLKTVNNKEESDNNYKVVATATLLNLIQIEITDKDEWTPPTDLQKENLKRVFGIDIEEISS